MDDDEIKQKTDKIEEDLCKIVNLIADIRQQLYELEYLNGD